MRLRGSTPNARHGAFSVDETPEARIGRHIEPQPNGCWLYNGETDRYGRISLGKGMRSVAHVFVYETLIGPVPAGYHLHHECETPGCCNPEHLTPLHPSQHKAEHALLRIDETQDDWKRDPLAVLRYAETTQRRRGA